MASPPRKRRQNALLGIHFDFHALPGQTVPPLPPLTVTFSPALTPVSVLQLPENRPLELHRHPDGSASVTVPSLDIHTVLATTLA